MAEAAPLYGRGRRTLLEELANANFQQATMPEDANTMMGNSVLSIQQRGGRLGAMAERNAGTIGQRIGGSSSIEALMKQRKKGLLSL